MAAHQALLSLGFSRQEHWSGLPFPSPMHESEKWKWKWSRARLLATPWTAAYQAPPSMGFSRPRVLEWGAIAFSAISLYYYKIIKVRSENWHKLSHEKAQMKLKSVYIFFYQSSLESTCIFCWTGQWAELYLLFAKKANQIIWFCDT